MGLIMGNLSDSNRWSMHDREAGPVMAPTTASSTAESYSSSYAGAISGDPDGRFAEEAGKIAAIKYRALYGIDGPIFRSPNKKNNPTSIRRRARWALGVLATVAVSIPAFTNILDKLGGIECYGNESVSVKYGDTVWGRAGEVDGSRDLSRVSIVDEIMTMNPELNEEGANLVAGNILHIPEHCEE